jgi:hypothetical protein
MMSMHVRARPKMRWMVMDATAMKARERVRARACVRVNAAAHGGGHALRKLCASGTRALPAALGFRRRRTRH